jgi:ABC-type amino acid transport substrate-binding protein
MNSTRQAFPGSLRSSLVFVGLTALVLSGCALVPNDLRPALRVGVSPTYPPVVFEQNGEIRGIEADLAQIVADKLGKHASFHTYPFPELLGALERGEVDVIMSGLSITEERAFRVLFTEPYMQVGQLALIRSRDIARLGRIVAIKRPDIRVGYERGTTGEIYVADRLPRAIAFAFDDVDAGLRALRAGRIDYFVHDAPTIWRLAGDPTHRDLIGLYRPLTEEYLAWAVRRDDAELRKALDQALVEIQQQGLIEPILNRWIPVRVRVP